LSAFSIVEIYPLSFSIDVGNIVATVHTGTQVSNETLELEDSWEGILVGGFLVDISHIFIF
jgi:hypothetical protein